MNTQSKSRTLLTMLFLGTMLVGCGSDDNRRDPILGIGDGMVALAPTVTAVAPVPGAAAVAVDTAFVTAQFDQPVTLPGASSFTVTCAAPCVSPTGTISMDAAGTQATFAVTGGTQLAPLTVYTGRVTGATSLATGLPMATPYIWTFTTGLTPDATRPQVISTVPATTDPGPTSNIPSNTAISATFSEPMDPLTINATTFTVTCVGPCVSPTGVVSYSIASRTAVFLPAAALEDGETYTATIAAEVTDLVGNELAGNQSPLPDSSDYVWTFTTAAVIPPSNVTVLSTSPANGGDICPEGVISATFTVPSGLQMDPTTITTGTFTVTGPAPGLEVVQAASVMLDITTGTIATFTPLNNLVSGDTYTAVVVAGNAGVKDLAVPANEMLNDVLWTFRVLPAGGVCASAPASIDLGTASSFGVFGGTAGMTNTGIQTIVNGDIGTTATDTSAVTGFHDAFDVYTETPANIGTVNGLIYTCTTSTTGPTSAVVNAVSCDIATVARLNAETTYLELAGMPGGPDPGAGNLAGLTLTPGVYTAVNGSFMIEGADLTLDAQGNANATWVFQMATTLTVGGPGAAAPQSIILTNGAQSKNIFWQVGSAATINAGGGGTMEGTIISQAGVAFSTVGNVDIVTLNGRALSLGASVTLVDTIINVPGP